MSEEFTILPRVSPGTPSCRVVGFSAERAGVQWGWRPAWPAFSCFPASREAILAPPFLCAAVTPMECPSSKLPVRNAPRVPQGRRLPSL